jgi:hypothetical protein
VGGAAIFLFILAATVLFAFAGAFRSWRHFLVASLWAAIAFALIAALVDIAL